MARLRFVLLFACLPLWLSLPLSAQSVVMHDLLLREPRITQKEYTIVDKQPSFPGGVDALQHYVRRNQIYPDAARKANISGRVYVSFTVNPNGSLQKGSLLKGIGMGCDEEAIRLVKRMPKWIPGSLDGKAVRVKYNLPIFFGLVRSR